jgi:hypothetical protein
MRLLQLLMGLALGAAALWIDLSGPAPCGAGLVLGLMTIVSTGGVVALGLGLLAVSVATTQLVPLPVSEFSVIASTAGGLAGGLLIAHLERQARLWRGVQAAKTGVLLSILIALSALLPDDTVRLFTQDGAPLLIRFVVSDAIYATRSFVEAPCVLPHVPSMGWLIEILPYIAFLTVVFLLLVPSVEQRQWLRWGWGLALLTAMASMASGIAGFIELSGTVKELPTAETWGHHMAWMARGTMGVEMINAPSQGWLTHASRPGVDTLRFILGGMLFALAAFDLNTSKETAREVEPSSREVSIPVLLCVLALALLALAGGFAEGLQHSAHTMALGGGLLLLSGACVGSLLVEAGSRTVHDLQVGALAFWVWAWLAPTLGWVTV